MRNIEAAYDRIAHWADRDESTGCLISRYSVGSHGYAQAWDGETVVLAHRIVWEYHHGPIPDGMTVDHEVCRNRKCVEVAHYRLLTNLDNARRHTGRDWPLGFCVNGHDHSWWMPKSETRAKGYCHACRLTAQAKRRGHVLRRDVSKPRA